MDSRRNVILAVVAVILGVVCVADAHLLRTTEERAEAEKKVFDFEEGALRGFEVTRGERVIRVEKTADALWYVTQPVVYRADQATAESVEFELRSLRKEWRGSGEGGGLEKYGLQEPRLRFKFWVTEKPEEVHVGDEDPGGGVYIKVQGRKDGLYTVAKSLYDTLARDLDDFRERRLIPFETYNVQTLILREGNWHVRWDRREDEWIVSTQGISDRADGEKIDEILRRIQELRAEGFEDGVSREAAAAYGLGEEGPGATPRFIHIGLKNDDEPKVAELGKPLEREGHKRVPARRLPLEESGTVLLLPESVLEDFGRDFTEFRGRKALPFSTYDVESFRFKKGKDELIVSKKDAGWQVTVPREVEADGDEVTALLRAFEDLEIEKFVEDNPEDLGPYGLEGEAMEISVTGKEGAQTLYIGEAEVEGGPVHGTRGDRESVFTLRLGELPPGPREAYLGILKRRVLDFSTFDAHLLEVEEGGAKRAYRKVDGKWKEGEEDARPAGEVVLSLSSLQAIRFVDDSGETAKYGLDAPSLQVSVEMQGEKKTRHTVTFGDDAEVDGRYARVEGSDFIFVANPVLVEEIHNLLAPPEEPPPEAPEEPPEDK